jgi:arylsulfatase A-like enzyme
VYLFDDVELKREFKLSGGELGAELSAYDGTIAHLDQQVWALLRELEKRGILKDTLVIITSDHGEEFGEHGLYRHGKTLYWPALHVPLLISFPARVPADMIVRTPVSLRDLPATVLDLIKLEGGDIFPGSSLVRYWNGSRDDGGPPTSPVLSEVHFSGGGPKMTSLVADGRHYIRRHLKDGKSPESLYDFESDPWEQRDLAGSEEGRRALTRFRTTLQAILPRR